MNPEQLADFAIAQYDAMAHKKLTVQQSAKVLISQVRFLIMQFPTDELKERFLAEFADQVLNLLPKKQTAMMWCCPYIEERSGLVQCKYWSCNRCMRGTQRRCDITIISDCKYYQPKKHGGKKK